MPGWIRHTRKILSEPERCAAEFNRLHVGIIAQVIGGLCTLPPTAVRVSRDIPNKNQQPFELAQTLH